MSFPAPQAPIECPWHDAASLHLLGHFAPSESAEYVAHAGRCATCREELARAEATVAELDLALALEDERDPNAPAPSAKVRERLAAAISIETNSNGLDRTWQRWESAPPKGAHVAGFAPGLYALGADEGEWEPIGVPGIEVRRLAADSARRMVTMMVRMAPGTSYPPHRHAADEECLVMSGELLVGTERLRAGDYQKAAKGSVHPVQSTDTGCALFITSSQDDELVG